MAVVVNQVHDHQIAGRWLRTVAMNAPVGSEVGVEAILAFEAWANSFPDLSLEDYRTITGHADILVEAVLGLLDERSFLRNAGIPPMSDHPLVQAASDAYWHFVKALVGAQDPRAMTVLCRAIESATEEMSALAVGHLTEIFERLAVFSPKLGADTLYSLGESSTLTYQPPRERRPERCREVYDRIRPLMISIAPELAKEAERNAFRHWSE